MSDLVPVEELELKLKRQMPASRRGHNYLLAIPKGWTNLVDALHTELYTLNPNYLVLQVKEKFGGLRYYCTFPNTTVDKQMMDIIARAERLSYDICDECGGPGELRVKNFWYSTKCDKHAPEGSEKYKDEDAGDA